MIEENQCVVRAATPADVEAIAAIAAQTRNAAWTRQMFVDELNRPNALLLVGDWQGQVVAFAVAWVVVDEAQILNVATRSDVRRRGYGRRVLEALLAAALDRGCRSATLEVRRSNEAALKLYERSGFARGAVRARYYSDDGEDAVLMARSISSGTLP